MSEEYDKTVESGGSDDGGTVHTGGRIGRFTVDGIIGSGGMGVVLASHDPDLGRAVAIKVVHGGQSRDRLLREAQAMARVAHPNTITIFEVGRVRDDIFIAMELVKGTSLRAWLDAEERTWREIVTMFIATGRGLAAVHAAGLVHRDFKPENVMVRTDGRPQVGDFGLAADGVMPEIEDTAGSLAESVSFRGEVVGTPSVMAPEQWLGEAVDARADQFAFSVSLWSALFREHPFPTDDLGSLRAAVLAGKRRARRPGAVPDRIVAALERGLARDPAARWPSLDDLLARLESGLGARRRLAIVAGVVAATAIGALAITAGIVAATRGDDAAPAVVSPAIAVDAGPPGLPDLAAVHPLTQVGRDACAYAPTIEPGGFVVFDRTEQNDVDLYRVPLAGGTPQRLTSAPTWEWRSNTGRRAGEVIHLVHDLRRRADSSIQWLDLATTTETLAAPVYANDAVAVGNAIFYTPFEGLELRRITAAGDETFALAPKGPVFTQLAASPRGDRLAVVGGLSGKLCLVDVTTAAVDCSIEGVAAVRPAFGADGAALYYGADDGIHRRDLASREDTLIVPDARTPGGLAVAPDASALIYSECGMTSRILDVSVDPPALVVADPAANDVAVGPHGEIAWARSTRGVRVLAMQSSAGQIIQGTRADLGSIESPAFSPDGKQIAFRVIGENAGIHLAGPEHGTWAERLTDGGRDYNPTWVDNDRIAFMRLDEHNRPSIYVMGADGGTPRRVSSTSRMIHGTRGTELLVSGTKGFFWLDADTGVERPGPERPDSAVTLAAVSPGGTWVLYQTGAGANDLWRISTAPGAKLEHLKTLASGETVTQAAITDDGHVLAAVGSWSGDLIVVPARAGSRF